MATDYSYIGKGKVYIREYGAADGLIEIGNCSALTFAVTEDTKELLDYTQAGGGNRNEVRRIKSVEMSPLTIHDLSPGNLAIALFGTATTISAGTVTDEVQMAYKGAIVPTTYPIDTGASVTVKDNAGTTTYVKDTDYTVSAAGITVLSSGAITNAANIKISYTKAAASVVNALTNSAKEYELLFDGLNEARSGKAVIVSAFRIKVGAAKQLGLIGDDFAALEVAGKLLTDTTKTGAGISQYFKVTQVT